MHDFSYRFSPVLHSMRWQRKNGKQKVRPARASSPQNGQCESHCRENLCDLECQTLILIVIASLMRSHQHMAHNWCENYKRNAIKNRNNSNFTATDRVESNYERDSDGLVAHDEQNGKHTLSIMSWFSLRSPWLLSFTSLRFICIFWSNQLKWNASTCWNEVTFHLNLNLNTSCAQIRCN